MVPETKVEAQYIVATQETLYVLAILAILFIVHLTQCGAAFELVHQLLAGS
jgi:hypothetical protein